MLRTTPIIGIGSNIEPKIKGALFEIACWDSSATILVGINDQWQSVSGRPTRIRRCWNKPGSKELTRQSKSFRPDGPTPDALFRALLNSSVKCKSK